MVVVIVVVVVIMLMVVMVVIMGNADVVLVLMAMVKLVAEVFVMREVLLTVFGKVVGLLVVVIEKSVALAIVSPEAAGTSDMLVVMLVIPAKISVLVVVKE